MEIVLNLWVLLKVTAGISLDKDYTRVLEKDTTSDSFPMDRICLFQVNSAEDFKIKERGVLTNRNNLPKAPFLQEYCSFWT